MRLLRFFLFPASLIYPLVVLVRNWAFDNGMLRSRRFKIPIISVGNITVGGTGKSPMTEYLVCLLKEKYKLAILSRGYGRRTKGYFEVKNASLAEDVGDEPLQFKHKFPQVTVSVCEDRIEGIKQLNQHHELILLDDAFQHRAVKPGWSILLFDYTRLFETQWFLPTGDLREPLSSKKRANILVVTKTPVDLDEQERKRITDRVQPISGQDIFFSYLEYADLHSLDNANEGLELKGITATTRVFLLTGLANAAPLVSKLRQYTPDITHHQYPDHHQFSKKNISKLAAEFKDCASGDKIIVTTEKDAQRLKRASIHELLKGLPVYYLPVKAAIHQPDESRFNDLIHRYVREHLLNNRIHKA